MAERASFSAFENENLHMDGSCGLWEKKGTCRAFLTEWISCCIEGRPRGAMTNA